MDDEGGSLAAPEMTGQRRRNDRREPPGPELGIDRAAFNRLRLDCGEEFGGVYEAFASELRSILRDVGLSVGRGDYAGLCHAAQALRGSAATFALHGLREAAVGVETACRLGETAHARGLADDLRILAERALQVLEDEVRKH